MKRWWYEIRDEAYDESSIELLPASYMWEYDAGKQMWCPVELYKISNFDSNINVVYYIKDSLMSGCVLNSKCETEYSFQVLEIEEGEYQVIWFDNITKVSVPERAKKEKVIIRLAKENLELYEKNRNIKLDIF